MQLPGKIGTGIRYFSVRMANLSAVTGVCNGAPFSFQSGINSFRADSSIQAPDRVCPPIIIHHRSKHGIVWMITFITYFRGFFNHTNAHLFFLLIGELLQTNCSRQSSRSSSNNYNIHFIRLSFHVNSCNFKVDHSESTKGIDLHKTLTFPSWIFISGFHCVVCS